MQHQFAVMRKKSVSHVNTILQNSKCYLSNIWLRMH